MELDEARQPEKQGKSSATTSGRWAVLAPWISRHDVQWRSLICQSKPYCSIGSNELNWSRYVHPAYL